MYFNLPENVQNSIYYLGPLETENLFKFYNLSDAFISFSLYHDEDYGMSPIESLFCGSDAVLTDWGGYHSFALEGEESCSLVKTSFKSSFKKLDGASFDSSDCIKKMVKVMMRKKNDQQRVASSSLYHEHFSIEACAKKLQTIMEKKGEPFSGFSDLGKEVLQKETPFLGDTGGFSELYFDTYKDYISE